MAQTEYFWEQMTIAEMVRMVKASNADEWNPLIEKLQMKTQGKINYASVTAAVHFFFCAAVIGEGRNSVTSETIKSIRNSVPDIIPENLDIWKYPRMVRKRDGLVWERLLGDMDDEGGQMASHDALGKRVGQLKAAGITAHSTLRQLIDGLKGQEGAWRCRENSRYYVTSEGYTKLAEQYLNPWDKDCRALWEKLAKAGKVFPDAQRAAQPAPDRPQEPGQTSEPVETPEPTDEELQARERDRREKECEEQEKENETFREVRGLIENGARQIILTGAPGTGKTYTAGLLAENLGQNWTMPEYWVRLKAEPDLWKTKPSYPLVQFHPSYDYTDFIEGLRPVEIKRKTAFVKLDGSFKAFCRQVTACNRAEEKQARDAGLLKEGEAFHSRRRYFFLIDEINRADLSKVFGELMFCLEADKRGKTAQTQYRNLPTYTRDSKTGEFKPLKGDIFAEGFFIPENVIVIGTMNDIDRSVESMDFALRRRFEWREVEVTKDMLEQAFQSGRFGKCLKDKAADAAQSIMALNSAVSGTGRDEGGQFGLNRQYYISQGQFANLPQDKRDGDSWPALRDYVWEFRVQSLLREYVRGEDETKVAAFLERCRKAFGVDGEKQDG